MSAIPLACGAGHPGPLSSPTELVPSALATDAPCAGPRAASLRCWGAVPERIRLVLRRELRALARLMVLNHQAMVLAGMGSVQDLRGSCAEGLRFLRRTRRLNALAMLPCGSAKSDTKLCAVPCAEPIAPSAAAQPQPEGLAA